MEKKWSKEAHGNILIIDRAWKIDKTKGSRMGAAYGWVLKTKDKILDQGKGKICANSPQQAEAYVVLYGIIEAHRKCLQSLEIWTDAMSNVKGCQLSENSESDIRPLLLLDKFNLVNLLHVARPKVNPAHLLAVATRKE